MGENPMSVGHFTRRSILSALAALAPSAAVVPARAESDYPNRPIRMIVGFAAGGGNDIFARLVGAKLSEILGQAVVIENKPAAGGRLAAEYVSQQTPDGYTLLVAASGMMSIAAAIYQDLKYDPVKSFTPLSMIANFPLIFVVAGDHPAKNVKELVEWGKQHPDKANYPSTSPSFTITSELFKLKSGIPGVMIPYKGSNEMILSVIDGQSLFAFPDGPPTVPQVKSGKLKALAVTGAERSPQLPDTPSMSEAGYPGVDVHLWSGVFAPTGTPAPIAAKLEKALSQSIRDPGVSDKLKAMAVNPGGGPADDFKRLIVSEISKYSDVVKAANLHFEE
jgi:tripartite-type tricarboxylate transporter receptor subunit TctC